jgi:four helix bundle protein
MGRDYRKLDVFHLADTIVTRIYMVTADFPDEERHGLIAQIRRAAISVPCNIVEGCARRKTGEYLHFISIAAGSANETRYLLEISHRLNMLRGSDWEQLGSHYSKLIAKLQSLMAAREALAKREPEQRSRPPAVSPKP